MSNPLTLSSSSNLFFAIFAIALLYLARTNNTSPKPDEPTNVVVYVHNYFTGHDKTAVTVAGQAGPASSMLRFGTVAVVDDAVTAGPAPDSELVGRARGMYVNSGLAGEALHMVFSVVFTGGEFGGSTLEIQGADVMSMEHREFGVVSGTGRFRFARGYGIMETHSMDIENLRAVIKLNITVRHF